MMIKVLFFGKFSDLVDNPDGLSIAADRVSSVDDIVAYIQSTNTVLHHEIIAPQVLIAVNQQVVNGNAPVADGDEVAFLPPVTGG